MGRRKNWNVSLDEDVVKEARASLQFGQKLSPVLNDLLLAWIHSKEDVEKIISRVYKKNRGGK